MRVPYAASAAPPESGSGHRAEPDTRLGRSQGSALVTMAEIPGAVTLELPVIPHYEADARDHRSGSRWSGWRYHTAYALIINTVSTTGLGFAYWAVAAHMYSPQTLGRSSALVSALILLSTLSQLNISSALQRFLPSAGRSSGRLIGYGYAASSAAALLAAVGFVLLMPRISGQWKFLTASPQLALLFMAAALIWGVFALEDAALVGLRRAAIVPVENSAYGALKLVMLICVAGLLPVTGIFASWVVPLVVIIPVINFLIFRRFAPGQSGGQAPKFRRADIIRFTSADYLASLFNQAFGSLLPLMVLSVLGPAANGSFYIAWTISAGPTMIAANFGTSLMVEAIANPGRLAELTRGIVVRCAVISLLCTAVLAIGAHPILRIYGKGYANQAAPLLVLLGLAAVPRAVIFLSWSLDRVAGRMGRAALTQAAQAILIVGCSRLLLGRYGIEGVGYAWLAVSIGVAIVRLPTIARAAGLGRHHGGQAAPALSAPGLLTTVNSSEPARRKGGKHRATHR